MIINKMVTFNQMANQAVELGYITITLDEHGDDAEVSIIDYDFEHIKFWNMLCAYRDQHSCKSYAPMIGEKDLCDLAQKAKVDPTLNEELKSAFLEEEYDYDETREIANALWEESNRDLPSCTYEYERIETLLFLNKEYDTVMTRMDNLEGDGTLQHVSPNDEDWLLANERFLLLIGQIRYVEARITAIIAIPPLPTKILPTIYNTDGEGH